MQKNTLIPFLINLILCTCLFAEETPIGVAVSGLEPKGIDSATADIVCDRLRTELFKTGLFTVMQRGQMKNILKEKGFQKSDCNSDACIVEMGKLLGVENMIAGTIEKVSETITINIWLIYVITGRMLHTVSVDRQGTIDDILSKSTVEIVQELIEEMNAVRMDEPVEAQKEKQQDIEKGTLSVNTEPQGATVRLDKVEKGLTPYTDSDIEVGTHALVIKMRHYTPIEKSIRISAGEICAEHFKLKHTKSYLDSLKFSGKEKKGAETSFSTKKKVWPKVVFGVISAASGAVGLAMNVLAQEKIDEYMAIEDDYENSNSNANYDEYNQKYTAAYNETDEKMKIRNICYIAAGVGLVCFGVSFAF